MHKGISTTTAYETTTGAGGIADRGGKPSMSDRPSMGGRAMKRLRVLLVLTLPLLLAGCGVIAAFIPPIDIGDPLSVDGQSLTTTFGAEGTASTSVQALSEAQSAVTRQFEDIELDLRGFSLSALHLAVGIDPVVLLQAPAALAPFPESFDLVGVAVSANVSDEVHGETVLGMQRSVSVRFALDRDSCALATCSYRYVDSDPIEDLLSIDVTARDVLSKFVEIVRLDGEPSVNTGSFSVSLRADSDPSLAGFRATFTLRSGQSVIELGG